MFNKKQARGFTLAETLIVMGIIGVVAALTIPNLTQSTGEKEKVAKLQKLHADLNDAFGRATAVYGPINEWTGGNSSGVVRFADRIFEFMKLSKNCGTTSNGTCFATGNPKYLNGQAANNLNSGGNPKAILADGASIFIDMEAPLCDMDSSDGSSDSIYKNSCSEDLHVDIDGPNKGPNTYGKDLFRFYITTTGIHPLGARNSNTGNTDANLKANCFVYGEACAAWIIENGNMDYLKATNGTCPNGTVLNWTNTSCK